MTYNTKTSTSAHTNTNTTNSSSNDDNREQIPLQGGQAHPVCTTQANVCGPCSPAAAEAARRNWRLAAWSWSQGASLASFQGPLFCRLGA
jgi:hypothetical protein